MRYYLTQSGVTINDNNEVVIMEDGEPTFELYRAYLISGGTVFNREFFTQEEIDEKQLQIETVKYLKKVEDGTNYASSLLINLNIREINNEITSEDNVNIQNSLSSVRNELSSGLWLNAVDKLIEEGSNIIGIELYAEILSHMNEYVLNTNLT